ncbi:MAG: hypothetical protein JXA58_01380, partial [Dehalococcoidia bacterium]|nr:hypothetical protein [Dehalococcoidia bacterium]
RYGLASATLSTTRQVGMVLSMGIATLFIASTVGTAHIQETPVHLFVQAMQSTFVLCTIACVVGIVPSVFRGAVHGASSRGDSL